MKIVFTFFVSVFSIFFIYSQCDNGTNYYPTTIYDPAAGSWGSAATNNWAGEVIQVTVVSGDVYQFSTCATFGGVEASYDTQLTLRDEGNLVLAFNDDGCGGIGGAVVSWIYWTATYSGTAYLHLNLYDCLSNQVDTEVRIFRTSAPLTYVPDDAFEHFLETHAWDGTNVAIGDPTSMGNGVDYDDFVFTASIDTITDLYMLSTISTGIDFPGIFDLTGIEDFTALYHLNVNFNSLTSVDLSNNPDLYGLHVSDQVNGALTSVNVSNNTLLDHVYIARNNLTSLDLSNNIALTELSCNENLIPSLDLSNNTALSQLWCYENQLTSLDLSAHSALTLISCSDNQLSCLNVKNGNNTNLSLWAIGNPLTCIEVDDPTSATADWTVANDNIDVGVTFSTNCNNDCSTVGLQDEAISSISIFPNPFNSEVEITSDVLMNRISVLDMSGKEVFRSAPENKNMKLKLDFLKSGVYTLVVESDEMITTRRIIKK